MARPDSSRLRLLPRELSSKAISLPALQELRTESQSTLHSGIKMSIRLSTSRMMESRSLWWLHAMPLLELPKGNSQARFHRLPLDTRLALWWASRIKGTLIWDSILISMPPSLFTSQSRKLLSPPIFTATKSVATKPQDYKSRLNLLSERPSML